MYKQKETRVDDSSCTLINLYQVLADYYVFLKFKQTWLWHFMSGNCHRNDVDISWSTKIQTSFDVEPSSLFSQVFTD